jgi:multiple sugar transport system substrate-binding protein
MTYQGKTYAIPQVVDMQLLVYRKSMLQKAGVQPPQTLQELVDAAGKLTTGKVKGLFLGNNGGTDVMGGPVLWSAGADYLTSDGKPGFTTPDVYNGFATLHKLFTSGHLLLGAPTDWSDPSAFTQGLCAMQWTGLWTFPMIQKALSDDFGVLGFPAIGSSGKASVPVGAYGACVSAKSKHVDVAKELVKFIWIDRTDFQTDFATSYGFHIPSRASLAAKASKLKTGQAADAVKLVNEVGHAQTPIQWTPAMNTAYTDALTRMIKSGANPASELATVKSKVDAELARIKA